jgi:hypothetical protein
MPGPAVRCPACGHALFTVDEPAWPASTAPGLVQPAAPPRPPPPDRHAGGRAPWRLALDPVPARRGRPGPGRGRLGRAVRVPRRGLERLAGRAT